MNNFIPHKDYELFESGFSGFVKTFDPEGNLILQIFNFIFFKLF